MDSYEAFCIFILGVLVGMYLSEYLEKKQYEEFVRSLPEILKEKEK